MLDAGLFGCLNDVDADIYFVDRHGGTDVEYSVDVLHCVSDIFWDAEIADDSCQVVGMIEIGMKLPGRFIRMDERSNSGFWIGEEEGDKMATLLAVCQGQKNDL